jgi:uncharacterized secreted protein with C-terminal beta-propeller domain
VIDVRTPSNPREVGAYDTPGYAYGVVVAGNYAYVADRHGGFRVIDVSTPSNPREVGAYDTPGYAFGVAVSGNYAYVADGWEGLRVIDISTPSNPREVGAYDTPGYAFGVAVSGNYAYVADRHRGLRVIDVSTPSNPREVGAYDTPGEAYGVAVSGDYVYLADYGSGFWIFKVSPSDIYSLCLTPETAEASFPNPFNPECYIPIQNVIPTKAGSQIKIYNLLGQLIREIKILNPQSQISKSIYWDGRDTQGLEVPAGVYFYEVAGERVKQMMVLK